MRKLLGALCLVSALVFSLAVHAAAPTSFAGTWTLDKSKSQNLSQRVQNVDISWTITQTDKTLTIEEKVTGAPGGAAGAAPGGAAPSGAPPAGGPPAGGGGGQGGGQGGGRGMGGGMNMGPRVFNLDGSETSGEMGRGTFVRKASVSSDGKTLELATKNTFQGPEGEVTTNQTDKFSLSADGKVLTVARHSESPRGPQDSTWVLNKQ